VGDNAFAAVIVCSDNPTSTVTHRSLPVGNYTMSRTATPNRLLRVMLVALAIVLVIWLGLSTAMMTTMPVMDQTGHGHGGSGHASEGGEHARAAAGPMERSTASMMLPGMSLMILMPLVFLAVLIGGAYLLYRVILQNWNGRSHSALQELREAFARGDLSEEEFETRRELLERTE
jgi:uncharacterized membrane protein